MIHRFDADQEFNTSVPIGRPIDNVHVYLLDGNQNLVPQGVIGEIYLAGDGLADGFLGQPSRTAKLFLPDPFGNGTRMYRTGDLGRLDPEGNVVYLGRIDDQVKIRGVRIERGEVETALRRHPAIRACVVGVDQYESTQLGRNLKHCRRCGLPSNYPEVGFDENGVCQLCSSYETYREKAQQYFRSPEDLRALFTNSRRSGSNGYDCIMLFSGGKDSTYALYQLVAMDLKILAFTLDNGYISDEAKANIRRVVDELRIDHVFGGTTAMPKIFVDSLRRHSNVCHGCFKTIYTLSTKLARDKGIRFIVTGLSRGQFFETRLTQELFEGDKVDSDRIDEFILAARKAYHQVDDEVSRIPEASVFQSEQIFQDVQFVDFYRYCDVGMDEVLEFLNRRAPWIRPSDTGRSTNCLINDVGIHIHKRQRGYHNYALPYSWDVRVGHKNREAALDELSDQINVTSVRKILAEIGYRDDIDVGQAENRLVAYYVSDTSLPASELRTFLSRILPVSMLPSYFVRLEDIPLSSSGKVDWRALPRPEGRLRDLETTFVPPRNDVEQRLAKIWAKVLRVEQVGVTDNFFDLGGDSIMALQIIARALESGLRLLPNQLFQKQTIAELAAAAGTSDSAPAEQGLVTGSVPLTPVQHRFFEQVLPEPHHWNQSLLLEISRPLDQILLEKALQQLLRHHDALRLRFSQEDTTWQQINQDYSAPEPIVRFDLSGIPSDQQDRAIEEAEKELQSSLNLSQGPLIRLAIFELGTDRPDRLLLILHHLIVDGVSWLILLEDLETLYEQLSRDNPVALPPKSMSFKAWSETLTSYADREDLKEEINYWIGRPYREAGKLPLDKGPRGANLEGSALDLFVSLDTDETQALLEEVPGAYHVQVNEVLLTALAISLCRHIGADAVQVDLEGHGRESLVQGIELTRSVGWYTSVFPLVLTVGPEPKPGEVLQRIRRRIQKIPNRGVGYGLLRYLCNDARIKEQMRALENSGILFNYLGRFDRFLSETSVFRFARELSLSRSPQGRRRYALEVNAYVVEDQLLLAWRYSQNLHRKETIARIAEGCITALQTLINNRHSPDPTDVSAADFPLANLDSSRLGQLSSLLNKADKSRTPQS